MRLKLSPICVFTLAVLSAALLRAQPAPATPEMLNDAELTAVTFVDADRGWAVGDRGVIWHTADGGRSWKIQTSGVSCRLEAVQFVSADIGFAAGAWTQPYTHETHGVVLRTRDGGRTWQETPGLMLPGLRHLRFFDPRQGWALGDHSPLFPSGVFRTDDGGRSWSPVPKGESAGWVAGDFRDARTGAVAGLDGSVCVATTKEIRKSQSPNLGPRYLRRLLLTGENNGWLVGDGGLVVTTKDNGVHWQVPPGSLPDIATANFDFRALAVRGSHIWIAGAPGTCIFHSPDDGRTWQVSRTDQTAPLRGLHFIDEHRGWAVGSLGTILHTRDCGQTWRAQRTGGARVALLGVFSDASRLPLELIAAEAGSEAYLTAMEIIGRRDGVSADLLPQFRTLATRAHEAVVAAGGSISNSIWNFPLGDPGIAESGEAILERWNRANEGQGKQRLEQRLVCSIRQLRPDVLITEDISPRGEDPLAHLVNRVTLDAVAKAADPSAYPDQVSALGLSAWKVRKLFTVLPAERQGLVNIAPATWTPRLARSIAEQAALGRVLLTSEVTAAPRNVGLALLVDHLPQESGKRDIMSGITLLPASEARRALSNPPAGNLESLSRQAQKRHNIEQLLARIDVESSVGAGWIGQVGNLTEGLGDDQAGCILWQLGGKYQASGRSDLATESIQALLTKHASHPLADAAAIWLLQSCVSSEIAWCEHKQRKSEVALASVNIPVAQASPTVSAENPTLNARQRAMVTPIPEAPAARVGRAFALAKQIEQSRPVLSAEPALNLLLAVAARQSGQPRLAERHTQKIAEFAASTPWAACAAAEKWIAHPSENTPKKVCSVVTAVEKPRLDGRLDDSLWQTAKPVSLRNVDEIATLGPAAAAFAYDDEFLYFSVSCPKAPGVDYKPDVQSRLPDSDLSLRDHVTLYLDLDRDYATYWTLAFDDRGNPADFCFGDKNWNPQWYIAASGDAAHWTIEAAIPWAELAPKKPEVRDVWAIGIQRTIPRTCLQSLTTPAAVKPRPEGFGLLVFE